MPMDRAYNMHALVCTEIRRSLFLWSDTFWGRRPVPKASVWSQLSFWGKKLGPLKSGTDRKFSDLPNGLFIVIFVPAGPQNVSPVLNDLARLRATAKFQITPACNFRESILIPFFFFGFFACRRWFYLFVFTSVWDLQPDGAQVRSPLIVTRQNQQAAPVCSKVCLNLFWRPFFAAVPLWKRVSVCTWYKKTFLGGFFLVGSTFSGYVRQETHQPTAKKSHFQT